jgi:hypothetical protein
MAPAGQNGRVVLGCRDCHLAEESGVGFKPVSMERQCASCHRLEFEPDVTSRQVPHGSERNVMLTLREFYASEALGTTPLEVTTVDGLLRRPPMRPLEVRQRQAADWANEKALHVATDLFEVRVCVVCHEVSRTGEVLLPTASGQSVLGVPWKVAPVVLTQHFMPKASFEHAKHAAIDCLDCHKVTQSKNLAEVAMPEIGKCRECHVGAEPETHKISSNCELCHGFHRHSPPTGIKPSAAMVAGMPQSGPNAVSAEPRVVLSEPK